jgi:hypothetical protein
MKIIPKRFLRRQNRRQGPTWEWFPPCRAGGWTHRSTRIPACWGRRVAAPSAPSGPLHETRKQTQILIFGRKTRHKRKQGSVSARGFQSGCVIRESDYSQSRQLTHSHWCDPHLLTRSDLRAARPITEEEKRRGRLDGRRHSPATNTVQSARTDLPRMPTSCAMLLG